MVHREPLVAREEDAGAQMELEAAEALFGLARSSSLRRRAEGNRPEPVADATHSQFSYYPTHIKIGSCCSSSVQFLISDQPAQPTDYAPSTSMIPENSPGQMCSTSYQPNPVTKTRPKLTQAEKEERKVRRIMANRESARQTIRRRQAVHAELTKKAADALEENERLRKKKDLALEEYYSLKHTYKFFKARLDEAKKAAAGEPEAEKPGPSTPSTRNPVFLHNQPSIIPCFWPSILPPSFQYSSHYQNTSLSQFPMPHGDMPCSSHQGQEHSMGAAAPLLVYPVPWLLPLVPTHGTNEQMNTCSRCSWPDSRPHEDTNWLPSPQNIDQQDARFPPGHIVVPGLFSPVRPLETPDPPWPGQVDDTYNVNEVSTPEDRTSQRNQKLEDVFATAMARRRRKELMKLKNVRINL